MRKQTDHAYIHAYKDEVEAIRQQMLQEQSEARYEPKAYKTAKGFQPRHNDRSFLVLQPGIINTYLAKVSARA